jgi:DinB superfamily
MKYAELIDLYAAGPEMLRNATRGMSREQLVARPVPGKWSTLEVICHLADFEIVYADRIKRTIVEEAPLLADGDENQFAARLAYHSRELDEELQVIGALTTQVVRILRTLPEADFQRIGTHSTAGPLTLAQFVERKAKHIPHHVRFIEEKRAALGVR